jgi:hypothetical protein
MAAETLAEDEPIDESPAALTVELNGPTLVEEGPIETFAARHRLLASMAASTDTLVRDRGHTGVPNPLDGPNPLSVTEEAPVASLTPYPSPAILIRER